MNIVSGLLHNVLLTENPNLYLTSVVKIKLRLLFSINVQFCIGKVKICTYTEWPFLFFTIDKRVPGYIYEYR